MGSLFASPAGDSHSQTASTPKEGSRTKDDWEDESSDGHSSNNIKSKSKGNKGGPVSLGGRKRRRAAEAQRIRRAREKHQQAVRDPEDSPNPGQGSQAPPAPKNTELPQQQLQQREQTREDVRLSLIHI